MKISPEHLRSSAPGELERVYREAPPAPAPEGRFWGRVLGRVDTSLARSRAVTAILLPFERLRFGVDFTAGRWFFVHPRARLGRFRLEPGRSRWRDTETLRVRYDVSRLPLRRVLYDEIKPLSRDVCLGLGGVNLERGLGDLFFFLLEAEAP